MEELNGYTSSEDLNGYTSSEDLIGGYVSSVDLRNCSRFRLETKSLEFVPL
jgi:hypothetical protein